MPFFPRPPFDTDAEYDETDPGNPVVEHREFELFDLAPEHEGLRIVQLTDIHVGKATPAKRVRAAVAQANAFKPDVVVLTGDYLCHDPRGVGLIREQLAGLNAPAFAVLGNHDHWVDPRGARNALESLGYCVLQNANESITVRGERFTVVGVDDLLTGHANVKRAFRGAGRGSRVVLAHIPRTADELEGQRASLCLSGHTHGGHVNIPGLTKALIKSITRAPYLSGRYDVLKTQLYVSRGIGGAVMPLRINAPPEVTLITLHSAHPDLAAAASM